MRRGPKGKSAAEKRAVGERRPSRQVVELFPHAPAPVEPEPPAPPKWLAAAAKKIWRAKVERYRRRGQRIEGFEDTLAQLCALEAVLIQRYRDKETPAMAMVTAHRTYSAEFYDTPASARITASEAAASNPFLRRARGA